MVSEVFIGRHFSAADELAAMSIIGPCPREILQVVAALANLAESTQEHADDLLADGWIFRAEDARQRAQAYQDSLDALISVWGEPESEARDE